jgi:hypothetical protein
MEKLESPLKRLRMTVGLRELQKQQQDITTMSTIDERLERLVTTSEAHTRMIDGIADISLKNTVDISNLGKSITNLLNISTQQHESIEAHQQRFDAVINELQRQGEEVREMQSEVRGLQTENRRILDQLINRDNGNP